MRYDMRVLQIVGAILIAGGLFILIKAPTYSSDKSVFKLGDVEAKVTREHEIPPWFGGVALAAGAVLIVVGARKG
jgi:drug/metabolite transporter (DMT)-like permease